MYLSIMFKHVGHAEIIFALWKIDEKTKCHMWAKSVHKHVKITYDKTEQLKGVSNHVVGDHTVKPQTLYHTWCGLAPIH